MATLELTDDECAELLETIEDRIDRARDKTDRASNQPKRSAAYSRDLRRIYVLGEIKFKLERIP